MTKIAENGVLRNRTQDEENAYAAKMALRSAKAPLSAWESQMNQAEIDIPDALEHLYDAMSITMQDKVNLLTKDKIVAKKLLRSQKP